MYVIIDALLPSGGYETLFDGEWSGELPAVGDVLSIDAGVFHVDRRRWRVGFRRPAEGSSAYVHAVTLFVRRP